MTLTKTAVKFFTLKNNNDVTVVISNYGARIVSVTTPDKNGKIDDIVLGYNNEEEALLNGDPYFGATIGRYANRIAKGKFTLDGVDYTLAINNGENGLHGGIEGYNSLYWNGEQNGNKLTFSIVDADMHEGYPGTVNVSVTFELNDNNELVMDYKATTDKNTHFNITNHAYFNLKGAGNGTVEDHEVIINADKFTPLTETQVPTGEIVDVKGTPFDFTELTLLSKNIDADDDNIRYGAGFDHNWIINGNEGELRFTAKALESTSGRVLEVYSTEPGVQLYTGNWVEESNARDGKVYGNRAGFCFETQHFPDSPNHPHFPSTLLTPEKEFTSTTIYKFGLI